MTKDTMSGYFIGNKKYLGKVWGECFFGDLREVKGFWKSNLAVKFSGATGAVSEPFQVQAQDTRQEKQFDTLRKRRKRLTNVGSFVIGSI